MWRTLASVAEGDLDASAEAARLSFERLNAAAVELQKHVKELLGEYAESDADGSGCMPGSDSANAATAAVQAAVQAAQLLDRLCDQPQQHNTNVVADGMTSTAAPGAIFTPKGFPNDLGALPNGASEGLGLLSAAQTFLKADVPSLTWPNATTAAAAAAPVATTAPATISTAAAATSTTHAPADPDPLAAGQQAPSRQQHAAAAAAVVPDRHSGQRGASQGAGLGQLGCGPAPGPMGQGLGPRRPTALDIRPLEGYPVAAGKQRQRKEEEEQRQEDRARLQRAVLQELRCLYGGSHGSAGAASAAAAADLDDDAARPSVAVMDLFAVHKRQLALVLGGKGVMLTPPPGAAATPPASIAVSDATWYRLPCHSAAEHQQQEEEGDDLVSRTALLLAALFHTASCSSDAWARVSEGLAHPLMRPGALGNPAPEEEQLEEEEERNWEVAAAAEEGVYSEEEEKEHEEEEGEPPELKEAARVFESLLDPPSTSWLLAILKRNNLHNSSTSSDSNSKNGNNNSNNFSNQLSQHFPKRPSELRQAVQSWLQSQLRGTKDAPQHPRHMRGQEEQQPPKPRLLDDPWVTRRPAGKGRALDSAAAAPSMFEMILDDIGKAAAEGWRKRRTVGLSRRPDLQLYLRRALPKTYLQMVGQQLLCLAVVQLPCVLGLPERPPASVLRDLYGRPFGEAVKRAIQAALASAPSDRVVASQASARCCNGSNTAGGGSGAVTRGSVGTGKTTTTATAAAAAASAPGAQPPACFNAADPSSAATSPCVTRRLRGWVARLDRVFRDVSEFLEGFSTILLMTRGRCDPTDSNRHSLHHNHHCSHHYHHDSLHDGQSREAPPTVEASCASFSSSADSASSLALLEGVRGEVWRAVLQLLPEVRSRIRGCVLAAVKDYLASDGNTASVAIEVLTEVGEFAAWPPSSPAPSPYDTLLPYNCRTSVPYSSDPTASQPPSLGASQPSPLPRSCPDDSSDSSRRKPPCLHTAAHRVLGLVGWLQSRVEGDRLGVLQASLATAAMESLSLLMTHLQGKACTALVACTAGYDMPPPPPSQPPPQSLSTLSAAACPYYNRSQCGDVGSSSSTSSNAGSSSTSSGASSSGSGASSSDSGLSWLSESLHVYSAACCVRQRLVSFGTRVLEPSSLLLLLLPEELMVQQQQQREEQGQFSSPSSIPLTGVEDEEQQQQQRQQQELELLQGFVQLHAKCLLQVDDLASSLQRHIVLSYMHLIQDVVLSSLDRTHWCTYRPGVCRGAAAGPAVRQWQVLLLRLLQAAAAHASPAAAGSIVGQVLQESLSCLAHRYLQCCPSAHMIREFVGDVVHLSATAFLICQPVHVVRVLGSAEEQRKQQQWKQQQQRQKQQQQQQQQQEPQMVGRVRVQVPIEMVRAVVGWVREVLVRAALLHVSADTLEQLVERA
ncbi:hypothetical protein Agub_g10084, partial [Astrephomene gubernaculifera]